jgi:TetR/AcrR family transcriptional repressor of nem operon
MARNVEFDETAAIESAMEVFWKKGYSAASLRELTDAMKINSSSLYNTIGDKHALFVRCIQNYMRNKGEWSVKRAREAATPIDAVMDLIDDTLYTIISRKNSCFIIKATFEVAMEDEQIMAILKEDNAFTYEFIRSLLANARDAGQLGTDEDPAVLTDYIISSVTGWHESFIIHQDADRITKMAAFLKRQLAR